MSVRQGDQWAAIGAALALGAWAPSANWSSARLQMPFSVNALAAVLKDRLYEPITDDSRANVDTMVQQEQLELQVIQAQRVQQEHLLVPQGLPALQDLLAQRVDLLETQEQQDLPG
jgi:hypothetical protein